MSSVASWASSSPDPNRLALEHTNNHFPPRSRSSQKDASGASQTRGNANSLSDSGSRKSNGKPPTKDRRSRGRSRTSRRGESRQWKKLLWIKQPYPDNYTDASTFLSHLQVNPRLQIYDFWPLVVDSTVIVQHICAVAIFICCFVGIYQERVSPISVVGTATACSLIGWFMWDFWLGWDEKETEKRIAPIRTAGPASSSQSDYDSSSTTGAPVNTQSAVPTPGPAINTLNLHSTGSSNGSKQSSRSQSASRMRSGASAFAKSSGPPAAPAASSALPSHAPQPPFVPAPGLLSSRNQQRLATAKSAFLIYLALLGLAPILKSLTLSTSSDSIWAMSCWLILTNIFTFDYGGSNSPTSRFPASLSTNAAVMASTVLASRLPSTTHVFSLTLFSIEVFGLFPVFRRHLRHRSFALHVLLTVLLILISGAGLGMTVISGGAVKSAIIGVAVWGLGTVVSMGGCSWWLIGLQKYKNVVIGPWDPARPIIRAGAWEY